MKKVASRPNFVGSLEQNERKYLISKGVYVENTAVSTEYCSYNHVEYKAAFPELNTQKMSAYAMPRLWPIFYLRRTRFEAQQASDLWSKLVSKRVAPGKAASPMMEVAGENESVLVKPSGQHKSPEQMERARQKQCSRRRAKRARKKSINREISSHS